MEDKIKLFKNYIVGELIPAAGFKVGGQLNVSYVYITEKTVKITLHNISSAFYKKINQVTLKNWLSKLFDFNFDKSGAISYTYPNINITVIDLSKVSFNVYTNLIKLVGNKATSLCHDYFCYTEVYAMKICGPSHTFTYQDLYTEYFNTFRSSDVTGLGPGFEETLCKSIHARLPSRQWIKDQVNYVETLDDLSSAVLYLWSTNPGYTLINPFIRNKNKVNGDVINNFIKNYSTVFRETYVRLMGQEFVNVAGGEKYISSYIRKLLRELRRIIEASPRINREFYVYRGLNVRLTGYSVGDEFLNDTPTGTSAFCKVSLKFSENTTFNLKGPKGGGISNYKYGTIIRYRPKGACLLMSMTEYIDEYEILLPPTENYQIKRYIRNAEFIYNNAKIMADYIELN